MTPKVYGIKDPQYHNRTAIFQDIYNYWWIIGTDGNSYPLDGEIARREVKNQLNIKL